MRYGYFPELGETVIEPTEGWYWVKLAQIEKPVPRYFDGTTWIPDGYEKHYDFEKHNSCSELPIRMSEQDILSIETYAIIEIPVPMEVAVQES